MFKVVCGTYDKKYTTGVLGVVVNRLEAEAGKSPA